MQNRGRPRRLPWPVGPRQPSCAVNSYFNRPNVGRNIHGEANRLITVRDVLRRRSFPDDDEIASSGKREIIFGEVCEKC